MNKKATTKEIARLAAVSVGTVDRVIHNRGQVSEATRMKVLKIIEELDYQPNLVARHLVLKKTYHIVALLPRATDSDYWIKPQTGVKKAVEDLKQMPLNVETILFDQLDPDDFHAKADECIRQAPDGIIIAPVVYDEAVIFTSRLQAANIPYLFIDSTIDEANPLCFIGQNSFQSGYLAAKLLHWGNKAMRNPLIVLPRSPTDNNRINSRRTSGFNAYFEKKAVCPLETVTDLHLKQIENGEHIDLTAAAAIFVPNSKVYLIAEQLKNASLAHKPALIGYDLTPANLEYLKEGYIDFLIHQKPETQGYQAVQTFFRYLVLGEKEINPIHFMPLALITRENMDYYEG